MDLQDLAFELAQNTGNNLFITGKAGTGKTTFLKHLYQNTTKNCIIVAPTGVAAIHSGGTTIHSFFGLPLVSYIPTDDVVNRNIAINRQELSHHFKYQKDKRKLMQELELLIIDEISMVRADLLDAIDFSLRFTRRNSLPFGGVQLIMIGDMYQLQPVVREESWNVLSNYYKSPYFFDAIALQNQPPICIEFQKIYRQQDENFIALLNAVRFQEFEKIDFKQLENLYKPDFQDTEGYITLTTHNHIADEINHKKLMQLEGRLYAFDAVIEGQFRENALPTEASLQLKKGAQVMFIRNDATSKRYFNGKLATVARLDADSVYVRFENETDLYLLEKETWENINYTLDKETGGVKQETLGSFSQYPIRLAWAVTIHKSQGLTFDKVIIDAGRSFASGQVYVALSRCRTLEGIVLKSTIKPENIIQDATIHRFQQRMWEAEQLAKFLHNEQYNYALELFFKRLDFDNILEIIDEWKNLTMEKNIPQKELVLKLISVCKERLETLEKTNNQFKNNLLQKFKKDNPLESWEFVTERCGKSVEYFSTELYERLWLFIHPHYASYSKKARVKQYVTKVHEVLQLLEAKIQQLLALSLLDKSLSNKIIDFNITEDKPKKAYKGQSLDHTLELLEQGKKPKEIAEERDLALSTIYGHISKLIQDKKVMIEDFLSKEKIDKILKTLALHDKPNMPMSELREKIGDTFSYHEIQWVRAKILSDRG